MDTETERGKNRRSEGNRDHRKGTDLWACTYYGFQNDNAPVFQIETSEKYFSFVVKTEFESSCRFDQCGVVMYLDSDNWFKASIEYEDEKIQRLGECRNESRIF